MPEFILYALAGIGTLTAILAVGWGLFWCIHEYIIDPYYQKQIAEALKSGEIPENSVTEDTAAVEADQKDGPAAAHMRRKDSNAEAEKQEESR